MRHAGSKVGPSTGGPQGLRHICHQPEHPPIGHWHRSQIQVKAPDRDGSLLGLSKKRPLQGQDHALDGKSTPDHAPDRMLNQGQQGQQNRVDGGHPPFPVQADHPRRQGLQQGRRKKESAGLHEENRYPTPRTVSMVAALAPSFSRKRFMWVSTVRVLSSGEASQTS